LAWTTYALWTGGATKVYGPWNNMASIATTGLQGSLYTYGGDGILIDSEGDLELLYCPSAVEYYQCTGLYQRLFKNEVWGAANRIPVQYTQVQYPWATTVALTSTRELSGSSTPYYWEMFVDSSNNLHMFEWAYGFFRDTLWTKATTAWTQNILLTSSAFDPPWYNLASIATAALSGSLGTDENAILVDTAGDLDLLYWDPVTLYFYHQAFVQDAWGSAYPLIQSAGGTGRPWTNTAVLTETRTLSGSGMTTGPSMLVDALDNLHVFYEVIIFWPPTHVYHDAVYDKSVGAWNDVEMFGTTDNDPPWVNTASIATTGLSGGLGTDKNAILIDSEGTLNLLYWSPFDHYLYHETFAGNAWSTPNQLYQL
jgi:hypothetical protein